MRRRTERASDQLVSLLRCILPWLLGTRLGGCGSAFVSVVVVGRRLGGIISLVAQVVTLPLPISRAVPHAVVRLVHGTPAAPTTWVTLSASDCCGGHGRHCRGSKMTWSAEHRSSTVSRSKGSAVVTAATSVGTSADGI